MHRWQGRKDVPIYRILWPELRADTLGRTERPRRNPGCARVECANPLCYERAIPMETAPFPLAMTRNASPRGRRGYKINRFGFTDQPIWRGEDWVAIADARGTVHQYPACPRKHILSRPSAGQSEEWIGRQAYCPACHADLESIKLTMGLIQPRSSHRPRDPARSKPDVEMRELMEMARARGLEDDGEPDDSVD
jgi:hypothetical protein